MSPIMVDSAIAEARAALLEIGGRDATSTASAIEGLPSIQAFQVMANASLAARPQWAGLVDDLFERPMLKNAKAGLRNALTSTLTGDSLYRNVFFSFADTVVLWHYGFTQERTGAARLNTSYQVMLRLLDGSDRFMESRQPPEPDVAYFHRLRRVKLTRDDAYPLLRRAGRLLGAVEAEVTQEKLHNVRGSMLTSYATFSAQVIAMARALRAGSSAIDRGDILAGLNAVTALIATPPSAFSAPAGAPTTWLRARAGQPRRWPSARARSRSDRSSPRRRPQARGQARPSRIRPRAGSRSCARPRLALAGRAFRGSG